MAEERPGILQRMLDKRAEWAAEQPSLGAELKAMAREAVKDVRSTVMETFLGSPELGGEPGAPLNPTPQMVTQDLGTVHGTYQDVLDMAASRGAVESPEKGRER
ncbi:MAG TPA: hypothetical protein VFE25_11925 [Opitutaceae bacterium]|nr:hypothetical protein [Opitutaceae bacterium]